MRFTFWKYCSDMQFKTLHFLISKTKTVTMKRLLLLLQIFGWLQMGWAQDLSLKSIGTYHTGIFDEGATEIVAYDASSKLLFSTNGASGDIDAFNLSDPTAPTLQFSIDLSAYGAGANSVAYVDGHIVAAVEDTNKQVNGRAVFFDVSGNFVASVEVGPLPDMVTVSPDGNYVLVANEGEPNDDYTVDPEGSVSLIDISNGVAGVSQNDVTTLDFTAFNTDPNFDPDIRIFGEQRVNGPALTFSVLGEYATGIFDEGATEIMAFDPMSKKLFSTNGDSGDIDIIDLSDATNPTKTGVIDLSPYGGGANSVAYHDGYLVAAVEDTNKQAPGRAVFFDVSGTYVADVIVGSLPDMVTFSPNGQYVLVANEGEPNDDYTIDPEGSVSVIDVSGGIQNVSQADVTTLSLTGEAYDPAVRLFGPATILYSEDFENGGLGQMATVSLASNRDWAYDNFGGDNFAEVNGFGGDTNSNDWLISPVLNLQDAVKASFSFYSASNFSGGTFEVLVSNNYDGTNPALAQWDTLTPQAILSPGGYTDTFSGALNLLPWADDSVYVAFHYTSGTGPGTATLWQIDDIVVKKQTLGQDMEPEYITVSPDNSKAFVTCQENNALVIIDMATLSIDTIRSFGFKDYNAPGNGIDASNRANDIVIKNWPVFGMYQPDAMAAFQVEGDHYFITANEGDARDYDGFSEEERVEDLTLDPATFPNFSDLQNEDSLGRLKITTTLGDTDGDGDYDALYNYGARSFSVWDEQGQLIWDSGDDFEQQLALAYPNTFNSDNDDNSSFKNRSDDKGPEPEALTIGRIGSRVFAFIGLERMGGVMVYDITDPANPVYETYFLNRNFSVNADDPAAGDLGPEDLKFIHKDDSPTGEYLLLASNEVSGNVAVYQIKPAFLSTRAQDLEPEYITVIPDSKTAFAVCQENNAIVMIDVPGKAITAIKSLGYKDHSAPGNGLDASNRTNTVDIRNWPVWGMYQPDAMASFKANGQVYVMTVNEGDARDYDGYSEEARVEDLVLDPTAFPNADSLQMEENLGRLKITLSQGDVDGDGDFDALYAYGARSFSIWDSTAQLVYDSGDDLEQQVFAAYPNVFNADNDDNSSFKNRSDDKGPEPEALAIGEVEGALYGFVGLERIGGVMTYNLTNPAAPAFDNYFLNRDFTVAADDTASGDLGPECLLFIDKAESPNGKYLLVAANEVSGNIAVYQIDPLNTATNEGAAKAMALYLYPNPVNTNTLFLSRAATGRVVSVTGQTVLTFTNTQRLAVGHLAHGMYYLITKHGNTLPFVK